MNNFTTVTNNSDNNFRFPWEVSNVGSLLPSLESILEQGLQNTSEYLSRFRFDAGYNQKLEEAFGNNFNLSVANQIFDKLAQGDFSDVPSIKIVNRHDINGANGAFAIATGKIYLAAEFISQNAQNIDAIVAVLLEEYGHYVDSQINTKDAAGDEGDIFARLVQGKDISQQELAFLQAEDDSATVTLDGQVVEIEQNTLKGTSGNDNINGTNGNDYIDGYAGDDWIDGLEGNDIIEGGAGNDIIYGWDGDDTIYTAYKSISASTVKYGVNKANGEAGNDIIEGDNGTDQLYGGADDDILNGFGGSDTLNGGTGQDLLYATAGIDGATKQIWGGDGSDTFILDARGETKTTLNFNVEQLIEFSNALGRTDTKWWRLLSDFTFAALGTVGINSFPLFLAKTAVNEGFNKLDAQKRAENAKRLLQKYPSDSWGEILTQGIRDIILIEDFEIGVDTIVLPNLSDLAGYKYGVSNLENRSGSNGVYVRIEGNNSQGTFQQQNIAFIKAPANYSTNNNNNMSFGELILDMIDSKAGTISVFKKSSILGNNNGDNLNGTDAYDAINGLGGNDYIEGKFGNDVIDGGNDNDRLFGGFHQNTANQGQFLGYLQDGDDFIRGGDGQDTIDGEYGNDIINGGNGNDELWGGEGSDVFLYDSLSYTGTDTIKDFNIQQGDKIFISKSVFTGVIDKTKFSYNTATNTLGFNGKNLAVLNANSGFNIGQNLILEAAEIFESGNYQGKSLTLAPGKYDVNDLANNGFGDNTLSSLKLPSGWSVLLYSGAGFTGVKQVFTSEQLYVGNYFNDQTTSLVIADGYAEVFEHGDYQGRNLKLAPGEYNLTDLYDLSGGAGFDSIISSLILPDGWRVTLYDWATLEGSQKVFTSSTSWVGNDWNDRAYSLKVEAPQPVPALALTNNIYTGTIGTSGNDTLYGGAGSDILNGGAGDDILNPGYSQWATDVVDGGEGTDLLEVDYSNKNDGAGIHLGWQNTGHIWNRATGLILVNVSQVENYNITGTQYDDAFEGRAGNDIFNGAAGNDFLSGGAGKDTLTGGTGADYFDYRNLTDSLLSNFDLITDFNATDDRFLVATARSAFNNVGSVASLDTAGISAKLTNTTFTANSSAQFTFGNGIFVAINDATAGFNATTDAIINVTGFTGTLGLNNFTTT